MEPRSAGYIFGGAGTGATMRANLEAFRPLADRPAHAAGRLRPRPLRRAPRRRDARSACCWRRSASRGIVHPDGELATARPRRRSASRSWPAPAAAQTIEEIAEASGDGAALVPALLAQRRRARREPRRAGPRPPATRRSSSRVDTFIPGWKPRDLQQAWLPFLEGVGIAQLPPRSRLPRRAREAARGGHGRRRSGTTSACSSNPSLTWDDLAWLRETTSLPIVLKGILHPDDARRGVASAASTGSSSPTTAAARSTGRSPRSTRCRRSPTPSATSWRFCSTAASARGADVFKALALGADAVLRRPALHLGARARGRGRGRDRPAHAARRARPDDGAERPPANRRPGPHRTRLNGVQTRGPGRARARRRPRRSRGRASARRPAAPRARARRSPPSRGD